MADAPTVDKRRLTRASSRSSAPGGGSIDDMNLGMIPGASGFGTFDRSFSNHVDWEASSTFPLNSSWNSMSRAPSFGSDAGGDLPTSNSFLLSPNPSIGAIDRNGSATSSFAIASNPFASSPDFLPPSMSKVPLDGFGSFSTARSRRVSGGAGGAETGRLLPDVSKRGGEALLQLQEVRGRGSNSPEDKFCSPLLAPSPPPLPKRRGRPPGSTKLAAAAAAAASASSSSAVAQAAPAASKKSPPPKRPRTSEKDDEDQFPEPITAPPLPAKYRSAAASAGGKARDKLALVGSVDEGDSLSSSDCSSLSQDDDKTLSWMRTRGKSGQFLGVGDCEIFFRVRIGCGKSSLLSGDAAFAAAPRIAIITTKTRDRVVQVTDCLRRGCPLPPPTTAFSTRSAGASDGGNRAGHGAGKVSLGLLRKMLGVEPEDVSQAGASRSIEKEDVKDKCAYELCPYPAHSSGNWKIVQPSTCAGQRDWSMFVGKMFCHACWTQYRTKGTLERLGRKDARCE